MFASAEIRSLMVAAQKRTRVPRRDRKGVTAAGLPPSGGKRTQLRSRDREGADLPPAMVPNRVGPAEAQHVR